MTTDSPAPHDPIRHAIILCHPEPGSFNHAVAETYCAAVRENWQEAIVRDLYAMRFDPLLRSDERPTRSDGHVSDDVRRELATLASCDIVILVYPIWFGTPPAMMKGYVERVLGSGVTPQAVEAGTGMSLLSGKRLLSFTTSATRAPWLSERGEWLALRDLFDRYIAKAFGMRADQHVHLAGIIPDISPQAGREHLERVRQQARETCALLAADRHRRQAIRD